MRLVLDLTKVSSSPLDQSLYFDAVSVLPVRDLFHKGWKHPEKSLPYLHAVYKIISPESSVVPFLKYQYVLGCVDSSTKMLTAASQNIRDLGIVLESFHSIRFSDFTLPWHEQGLPSR